MAAFLTSTLVVLTIGCMFAVMFFSCTWAVEDGKFNNNGLSASTASITAQELAAPVSTSVSGEEAPLLQIPRPGGCKPSDISFYQHQVSGVGLPRFNVHIANTCIHHNCVIRNIIAKCGPFHSFVVFVNPNLFRRLDYNQGTCLVNNGQPMRAGDSIDFAYCEVRMEPISFFSAQVSCQ